MAGPKCIAREVVALLNRELNEVLKLKAISDRFTAEGATTVGGMPEQLMQIAQSDMEKWWALVKLANIKIESYHD